jgi:hypothetical protein
MPVKVETPIVVPQKSFDNIWIKDLGVRAPQLNAYAGVKPTLILYNDDGEEAGEYTMAEADLTAEVMNDPDVALIYQKILLVMKKWFDEGRFTKI